MGFVDHCQMLVEELTVNVPVFFLPSVFSTGFVDIFSKTKDRLGAHASKILKFLHRNRIPSSAIPFPILEGYNSICTMRSSVVQDFLQFLLQKEKGEHHSFRAIK